MLDDSLLYLKSPPKQEFANPGGVPTNRLSASVRYNNKEGALSADEKGLRSHVPAGISLSEFFRCSELDASVASAGRRRSPRAAAMSALLMQSRRSSSRRSCPCSSLGARCSPARRRPYVSARSSGCRDDLHQPRRDAASATDGIAVNGRLERLRRHLQRASTGCSTARSGRSAEPERAARSQTRACSSRSPTRCPKSR